MPIPEQARTQQQPGPGTGLPCWGQADWSCLHASGRSKPLQAFSPFAPLPALILLLSYLPIVTQALSALAGSSCRQNAIAHTGLLTAQSSGSVMQAFTWLCWHTVVVTQPVPFTCEVLQGERVCPPLQQVFQAGALWSLRRAPPAEATDVGCDDAASPCDFCPSLF